MRRQLAFIRFAVGSAYRRWGRTLAISLGLMSITFAFSSVLFLTEALRGEFRAAAVALPDLTVQRLVAGRPGLIEEDVAKALGSIPGVVEVRSRVWGYYFVPNLAGNFTVMGVDADLEMVQRDLALVLSEGELPGSGRTDAVAMGGALATFLGLERGDAVSLPAGESFKRLELSGVFESSVALWTADIILMSKADAREFLQMPEGYATDLALQLSTPDEAAVVARKIAALLPGARIVDRQLMARTYDLTFDTRGGVMGAMLLAALVAFLVMAWDRLTGVGPGERREIGVLKATGWQTSEILLARLWENALMGFGGATLGLLLAYGYVFLLAAPGLADVLVGWSSIYPALHLTPAVEAGQVLVMLSLVVVPFVSLSLVPAWWTATQDPHLLLREVTG